MPQGASGGGFAVMAASRVTDARLGALQRERRDQAGHVADRDDMIVEIPAAHCLPRHRGVLPF